MAHLTSNSSASPSQGGGNVTRGRIELPGGWHLIRCDDASSQHVSEWFLAEPGGVWVAKFWDGTEAGRTDAMAFAQSLGVTLDADIQPSTPWVSGSCEGATCSMCGSPASAKVGEEISYDDPHPIRHNLTADVCAHHFAQIMGPAGASLMQRVV